VNSKNSGESDNVSIFFYLIVSICFILVAGTGVMFLVTYMVPAPGMDRPFLAQSLVTGQSPGPAQEGVSCSNLSYSQRYQDPLSKLIVLLRNYPPGNRGDRIRVPVNADPGGISQDQLGCGEHWVTCIDGNFKDIADLETGCYGFWTCEPDYSSDLHRCMTYYPATEYVADKTICEY